MAGVFAGSLFWVFIRYVLYVLPGKIIVDNNASLEIELTCRISNILHVSILEHRFRGFRFLNNLLLLLRHGYGSRVCAKAW
jgi:hypothetical protein